MRKYCKFGYTREETALIADVRAVDENGNSVFP